MENPTNAHIYTSTYTKTWFNFKSLNGNQNLSSLSTNNLDLKTCYYLFMIMNLYLMIPRINFRAFLKNYWQPWTMFWAGIFFFFFFLRMCSFCTLLKQKTEIEKFSIFTIFLNFQNKERGNGWMVNFLLYFHYYL